jgi:hypothetical protein
VHHDGIPLTLVQPCPRGLGFTLGAVAGIVAFIVGEVINAPTASRLSAIGRAVQTAGGPPTPAQMADVAGLQQRLLVGSTLGAVLLVAAAALMGISRVL